MIVERATHKKLADYMEEKVWRYIGAEYDASWSMDSKRDKEVKAFCCFNARPKDFAKIGRLYLNNGSWDGRQIISAKWVKESLNLAGKKNTFYSYQWWHTRELNDAGKVVTSNDFYADGLLGQFIYVYPEKNIIIIRLGKKEGINGWPTIMKQIARAN
jgi:CubicO group peptidase (beta-lactamase class C family)